MSLDLNNPADRRQARRELLWGDHGFLRLRFQNLHPIDSDMYRANQPSPEHLEKFAAMGIKTILNLRGASPKGYYLLEEEACHKLGLILINHQVFSRDTPTRESVHKLKSIYETMEYPAVMHCKSGADRTGIAGVLYKHFKMGLPIREALEQLRLKYLHIRQGKTGMLDFFFEDYLRYQDEGGELSFIDWIDQIYDREDVKSRFMASWIGSALTEKILRRE